MADSTKDKDKGFFSNLKTKFKEFYADYKKNQEIREEKQLIRLEKQAKLEEVKARIAESQSKQQIARNKALKSRPKQSYNQGSGFGGYGSLYSNNSFLQPKKQEKGYSALYSNNPYLK